VKVPAAERLRWLMGLAGLGFWLSGLWMLIKGGDARWAYRCPSPDPPDCFSDYIPVFEFFFAPVVVLLLAYPVARFTFTMWAQAPEERVMLWWPASRRGSGADLWPVGHLFAAAGIASSIWTLARFPLAAAFWPYYLYWSGSALWCALTLWAAWPPREGKAA
jgi:hypothetical protein